MDFSEALFYLKRGEKLARTGWNGKGMFIVLVPGTIATHLKPGSTYFDALGGFNTDTHSQVYTIEPHIDMRAAHGAFQPGWLASQADLLAHDWVLVP